MSIFKKNNQPEDVLYEEQMSTLETDEGQLSIDVYERDKSLIIKSTIAGARPEDIDISLQGDILVIKGKREMDEYIDYNDYLYRECYWGKFSRTIILPFTVDESAVEVDLDRGVLTIILPKAEKKPEYKISIKNND